MNFNQKVSEIKRMHEAALNFDNENLIYIWLTYGCPDGAVDDDFEYIAGDEELFSYSVDLFNRLLARDR